MVLRGSKMITQQQVDAMREQLVRSQRTCELIQESIIRTTLAYEVFEAKVVEFRRRIIEAEMSLKGQK